MKLTFYNLNNGQGHEEEIGIFNSVEEAQVKIKDILDEQGYKSYYFRISVFNDKRVYDVGSWSEFFILYDDDDEELNRRGLYEE